jgi:HlyD family secretion protein
MSKIPRPLLIGALVFALLAVGAATLLLRGKQVEAVQVQAGPLVRTLQFSARVSSLVRVDVGSTITGRVAEVAVRESDAVRQGDLLIALEPQELQAALAQATAAERQAQARLASLRGSNRTAADAALAQARANLATAQAELARAKELIAKGFVSASRLDEVQRTEAVARAQLATALAQAQAQTETGSDMAQAQAQFQLAQAQTAAAQARLAQARIVAPADGRVLGRMAEPGQIVQPGKALLSLALSGPGQLVAAVDERFLGQLQVGQHALVVPDAYTDQRLPAQVVSISPLVDAQRGAVEVKLALTEAAPSTLREDMSLSVEVQTARRDQALTLPLAALGKLSEAGSAQVSVWVDGRVQKRTVQTGLRTLASVEVLDGLTPSDVVLLDNTLPDGARVRYRLQLPSQAGAQAKATPSKGP